MYSNRINEARAKRREKEFIVIECKSSINYLYIITGFSKWNCIFFVGSWTLLQHRKYSQDTLTRITGQTCVPVTRYHPNTAQKRDLTGSGYAWYPDSGSETNLSWLTQRTTEWLVKRYTWAVVGANTPEFLAVQEDLEQSLNYNTVKVLNTSRKKHRVSQNANNHLVKYTYTVNSPTS